MKRLKYRNHKVTLDGITFDSKREMKRYAELKLQEKAGLISCLEIQPQFPFFINGSPLKNSEPGSRQIKYVADFRYVRDGEEIVEDVKSPITAKESTFRLKKALFETLYEKKLTII